MNLNQEINVIINFFKNREFRKVLVICERLIKKKIFNTQIYNFYGLALQNLGQTISNSIAAQKAVQVPGFNLSLNQGRGAFGSQYGGAFGGYGRN